MLMSCGVLYSIAWYIDWDEAGYMDSVLPKTLYFFAVLLGILGGMFMLDGLKALSVALGERGNEVRYITLASLLGFIAIMLTTLYGYDRPFTAELSLVFIWAVIELCTVFCLMRYGWLSRRLMFAIIVVISLGLYLSSMCYNFYYEYKFDHTAIMGMEIPNGLWMGILPYVVLVVVISLVLASVFACRKMPSAVALPGVRWDPDFAKRGLKGFLFWLGLGLLCVISGLLFDMTLSYHGDFQFTLLIIGAGVLYFLVYYPPAYHLSFGDPEMISFSDKTAIKGRKEAEAVLDMLAKRLRAKGLSVTERKGQKAMFDVELRSMDVLEVAEPRMLVVIRTYYVWPFPWKLQMQMLWGEVTQENNELAREVDGWVEGINGTPYASKKGDSVS